MTTVAIQPQRIRELESHLNKMGNEEIRLQSISELAGFYTFTNVREAQRLLAEQYRLLQKYQHPDLMLNYHLNTAIVENQFYNYRLSEIHFKYAVELVDEEGDSHKQVEVYLDFSGTLMNMNDRNRAHEYIEKAKRLLANYPNDILNARLWAREGNLWLNLADYDRATELLFQAQKAFDDFDTEPLSIKDLYLQTLIFADLGAIFERTGDLKRCIITYQHVIKMCEAYDIRSRLTWHYVNVGKAYMELSEMENAVEYFRKADSIQDDISLSARAHATANLGYAYHLGGRYDEALLMYNHAEQIIKRLPEINEDNYDNMSVISRWKGLLFDAIGKPKRAEKRFEEALEMAKLAKNTRQQAIICNDLAGFYAEAGDYRKAYEFERQHSRFVRSTFEEMNKNKINELEFKYEAERRQQEAEMLRLQATGLQLKALRAQMNPHFIFNALNSLQSYINTDDREFAAKYLAKFAKLIRDSLEYSELEAISLEDEVNFLEDYLLINQKLRFGDKLQYDLQVDADLEDDIVYVPTMIVQPYIENAIEHGVRPKRGGLIQIRFSQQDEDVILCTIEDNGIGRVKAREYQERDGYNLRHKSRGTAITEKRLEILNASRKETLNVQTIDLYDPLTNQACGTKVIVTIPIVELPFKN
jgi:two-component system, LytTR family, sensor kinase